MTFTKKALLSAVLAGVVSAGNCFAGWTIDPSHSHLSYISIKNGVIAESNYFKKLSGKIDDAGNVDVAIDMSSVETNIELRNNRVKEHLFHTAEFPVAHVRSHVDSKALDAMAVGSTEEMPIALTINAIGHSKTVNVVAIVSRLSESEFMVTNKDIIMINAQDFDTSGGLAKLKELAKLSTIETMVPATFQLFIEKS